MILGKEDLSLIGDPCLALNIKIHTVAPQYVIFAFQNYIPCGERFIFRLVEEYILRRQDTAVIGYDNLSPCMVGVGFGIIGDVFRFDGHRSLGSFTRRRRRGSGLCSRNFRRCGAGDLRQKEQEQERQQALA